MEMPSFTKIEAMLQMIVDIIMKAVAVLKDITLDETFHFSKKDDTTAE